MLGNNKVYKQQAKYYKQQAYHKQKAKCNASQATLNSRVIVIEQQSIKQDSRIPSNRLSASKQQSKTQSTSFYYFYYLPTTNCRSAAADIRRRLTKANDHTELSTMKDQKFMHGSKHGNAMDHGHKLSHQEQFCITNSTMHGLNSHDKEYSTICFPQ